MIKQPKRRSVRNRIPRAVPADATTSGTKQPCSGDMSAPATRADNLAHRCRGHFLYPIAPSMARLAAAVETCAAWDGPATILNGSSGIELYQAMTPAYELYLQIAEYEAAQEFIRTFWSWPGRKRPPVRNKPALLVLILRFRPMTSRHRVRCGHLAGLLEHARLVGRPPHEFAPF